MKITSASFIIAPARPYPIKPAPAPACNDCRSTDTRDLESVGSTNARRLVAAFVPGRVDFSGDAPKPSDPAALPFYRHPADANSAATSIAAGRIINVTA